MRKLMYDLGIGKSLSKISQKPEAMNVQKKNNIFNHLHFNFLIDKTIKVKEQWYKEDKMKNVKIKRFIIFLVY